MKNRTCPECGGPLVVKVHRHIENVGGTKVVDETAMLPCCVQCNNVDLTLKQLAGYERRAAALVLERVIHANGAMLRYARKALGITQPELAKLISHKPETISRWENDKRPVERAEQLALVALLDLVERGEDIHKLISAMDNLANRSLPKRLEVTDKDKAA